MAIDWNPELLRAYRADAWWRQELMQYRWAQGTRLCHEERSLLTYETWAVFKEKLIRSRRIWETQSVRAALGLEREKQE